jgi:DNA-binding MarR family transcriptional regulator
MPTIQGTRARALAPTSEPAPVAQDSVRAMDALRRMVRALSRSAREASSGGGLSGAQLFVLRQVGARPGLSIGQLAASTLSRQSTVSEVVSRLIERGMISRETSANDARQSELTLTAAGRRAVAKLGATAQERLAAGLASMPSPRRRMLADALESWLADAGLADEPAGMFFDDQTPAPSAGEAKRSPSKSPKTTRPSRSAR